MVNAALDSACMWTPCDWHLWLMGGGPWPRVVFPFGTGKVYHVVWYVQGILEEFCLVWRKWRRRRGLRGTPVLCWPPAPSAFIAAR